jgi:CRISPR-associated endonuclease/helicase Cas3
MTPRLERLLSDDAHTRGTAQMTTNAFSTEFRALTGNDPLSWQRRLFREWEAHELKPVIDIPTGLGKTMVMAIWLIARANKLVVPTRLIYVVDRRTVVDQATDLAEKLREKCRTALEIDPPAISALRGQLADNREWTRDPSRLAIIIGTVDLIGSALLFSGYRSSYKRRPLEAGLLGQDSLLVLDEAHLSRPFEKLVTSIGSLQKLSGKPMAVVRMSATSGKSDDEKPHFGLEFDADGNLAGEDAKDKVIMDRFCATKRLTAKRLGDEENRNQRLADEAIDLAQKPNLNGRRVVVFVRSPETARDVAERIRKHAKPSKSKSNPDPKGPYAESVRVLTGTMRGLERDELVEKPVFKDRWLNGDLEPFAASNESPVFLISTSAGEVGFDLNADHLVGDSAPLDSWIQRLGRVNRRGKGDAIVVLINEIEPSDKTDFDKACVATSKLLTDGMDVSPKALAAFKKSLTPAQMDEASSPKPKTVELTDILLDAWSMTSIIEPMPGRPEVGPWLRGIADELPQTTIAWRAELDVPGFSELDVGEVEEWFDAHRILTHEALSVPTHVAAKWFTDRWGELSEVMQTELADRPIVVDRAGTTLIKLKTLIDQLSRTGPDNTFTIRNADVILPASFGGIERGVGLLDPRAPSISKDEPKQPIEEQREAEVQRQVAPDVADIAPGRIRQRLVETRNDEEDVPPRVIGGGTKPDKPTRFRVDLEPDDDRTLRLISNTPRHEKPEYGSKQQTLREHVRAVCQAVDNMLSRLALPEELKRTVTLAARLAAQFHDHGKNRERWQRTIGGIATPLDESWSDQTLGKSAGEMNRDRRGYRHEFGSMRELADAFNAGELVDDAGKPINHEVFDLAMHLIAAHHGRGRPHFPQGGFDPDCEPRSDSIHVESIRRFALLQRRYGWWHLAWMENLLRCADAIASADSDALRPANTV